MVSPSLSLLLYTNSSAPVELSTVASEGKLCLSAFSPRPLSKANVMPVAALRRHAFFLFRGRAVLSLFRLSPSLASDTRCRMGKEVNVQGASVWVRTCVRACVRKLPCRTVAVY